MVVLPRPLLAFLLLAGGAGCADLDDVTDAGGPDSAPPPGDGPEAPSPGCSVEETVRLEPQPADVLVLLDRSGSMDTAFGSGTRFEALASLLGNVVSSYARYVRFGYQEFPGRQGCDGQALAACCVSPPTVAVADDNARAMLAAIAASAPVEGSTPTAGALQAAAVYYDSLADGIDNRYVLLATDGGPDCSAAGSLTSATASGNAACTDALAAVTGLVASGVRVLVLGVGPDFADDTTGAAVCLDALAHAGGAAASPGRPGYYAAADPAGLELAIEAIFGGVALPSCVLRFAGQVDDNSTVALFLDGQQIPRTTGDGWRLDTSQSPPAAIVGGTYCDAIRSFQVKTIEARFGCHVCVDIVECQAGNQGDGGDGTPPGTIP